MYRVERAKSKTILACPVLCLLLALASCAADEDIITAPRLQPQQVQPWTDLRDGHQYGVMRIGQQEWLTENLAYALPTGTAGGCFTWGEKEGDYKLEDVSFQPDTVRVVLTDSLYRLAYEACVADPAHDWAAEDNVSPATLRSYLDNYLALYGQEAFTDVMAYYPRFHAALLAALDHWRAEGRQQVLDAMQARCDSIVRNHRNRAEAEGGGYARQYGLLYSLDGARAAVPKEGGWRLPSDADWKQLEAALGLSAAEQERINAWRGAGAADLLKEEGSTGFNARMAGCNAYLRNNEAQYIRLGQCAYWWADDEFTSSEEQEVIGDDGKATVETLIFREGIVRQIAIYSNAIWRGTTRTDNVYRTTNYSVRLVRDVK